jgi:UDP-N-acetylglucosamine--N-acetylmuramyl-(pentapeptide) pyrophosphoryl-undecaprenol N-acetylglucosamine transferase
MDQAYAAADVAVMRAGAGTVAELAVCGLPSILVPYPFHADDHQAVNAGVLVDAGGAIMVRDADATADHVGPMIEHLLDDPGALARMGAAARTAARPRAAEEMAAWVLELAGR